MVIVSASDNIFEFLVEYIPTESRSVEDMIRWLIANFGPEGDNYYFDLEMNELRQSEADTNDDYFKFKVWFNNLEASVQFKLAWV